MYVVMKLQTPSILDVGSLEGVFVEPEGALARVELLQNAYQSATIVICTAKPGSFLTDVIAIYDPLYKHAA